MTSRILRANHALRFAREQQGWTQEQVATFLGTNAFTVYRWESGRAFPRPYHRQKLCELFGKDARELGLLSDKLALQPNSTESSGGESLSSLSTGKPLVYWHIPFRRNPFFTGREELLPHLHNWLSPSDPVKPGVLLTLSGLGGIGKTQLALEYAYRYVQEYSAVFWIGAENAEQVTASFAAVAELLELPECQQADQQRIVKAVQHWLTLHQGWLLILDNLEDPELLHRFLLPAWQGAVLITTRYQSLGTPVHHLELPPLEPEEAILLVLRRAKIIRSSEPKEQLPPFAESMPAEYAAAQRLAQLMERLPLALDQAGAYIEETRCSIADYVQRYEQQRTQLLARRGFSGRDHPQSVTATLRLSCQHVEQDHPAAADLLRVCAFLYAEAIPEELFVAECCHLGPVLAPIASDPGQFDQAIATLRTFSLIQRDARERTLSLHRLVQVVLQEAMSEQERAEFQQRIIRQFHALFPEATYETWRQCERFLPHVLAFAASFAGNTGSVELSEVLLRTAHYLRQRARYKQAELLYQQVLRLQEQISGHDPLLICSTWHFLAILYAMQGKYEQAESLFQRVLQVREHLLGSEHPEVAYPLNNLALIYKDQGKYAQAERLFQRVLSIREQTLGPDHHQITYPLNGLAQIYAFQGKYEEAEQFYQRELRIKKSTVGPEHPLIAFPLNGLAIIYTHQGKYKQAEALLQQALCLQERALGPDHPEIANVLDSLASLYTELGKSEQAKVLYERAIHIWEKAVGSDYHELASPLTGLASLLSSLGEDQQAEHLYRRAQHLKEQMFGDNHPEVAPPLSGLATLYREQGRYEEAETLYHHVLIIREQHLGQQHPETAHTLHDLALCAQRQGKLLQALFYAQRALSIRTQHLGDSHPQTGATRDHCAELARALGEQEEEEMSPGTAGKTFHSQLRAERERRGWSQQDVADHIGAQRYYISRWERGTVSPGPHYRQKLCALFGKDAQELGLLPGQQSKIKSMQNDSKEVLSVSSPLSRACWYVPYHRNPFFTGRTTILTLLHHTFHRYMSHRTPLPLALTGLAGIGKTQVALEYAYRYRAHYQAVFWLRAESYETLLADCRNLLDQLHLPGSNLQDPLLVIASLNRWLTETSGWLLILDNVEDPGLLSELFPSERRGHILLTTRMQTLGPLAEHIRLEKMPPEESSLFLLRRIRVIEPDHPLADVPETLRREANEIADTLDGLPLALDHVGAYLEETACSLAQYLQRYQARSTELLGFRSPAGSEYKESVVTTLSLSIEKVAKTSPAALDLLQFCSFLLSESIPEELALTNAVGPGTSLSTARDNPLVLDAAIRELRRFSLLERDPEVGMLSVHRLVQLVVRESLEEAQQRFWAERAVRALHELIPDGDLWEKTARTRWQRYLAHIFMSADLIHRWHMRFAEAVHLLYQTGVYLLEHARYTEAERVYRQALTICEDVLGQEHSQTGEILNDLALLSFAQGNSREAESLYQQALVICEQALGEEHPTVAHIRHNLAWLYQERGDYTLAEGLHQKVLKSRERALGPDSLPVAESLHALGSLFMSQQNFAQAEAFFQHALSIRAQALGIEHPLVAQSLTHLGKLYVAQGNCSLAEQLFVQALAIREKIQGPDHPKIASCLHALGDLYLTQERFAQAEHALQRAWRIYESLFPPEHTQRKAILCSLAQLAQNQANASRASRPADKAPTEEAPWLVQPHIAETPPDVHALQGKKNDTSVPLA